MDQCPNAESYLNPARAGYQAQLKGNSEILGFYTEFRSWFNTTMISGRPGTCTKSDYLVLIYSEKKYIPLITENINDEELSKFGH